MADEEPKLEIEYLDSLSKTSASIDLLVKNKPFEIKLVLVGVDSEKANLHAQDIRYQLEYADPDKRANQVGFGELNPLKELVLRRKISDDGLSVITQLSVKVLSSHVGGLLRVVASFPYEGNNLMAYTNKLRVISRLPSHLSSTQKEDRVLGKRHANTEKSGGASKRAREGIRSQSEFSVFQNQLQELTDEVKELSQKHAKLIELLEQRILPGGGSLDTLANLASSTQGRSKSNTRSSSGRSGGDDSSAFMSSQPSEDTHPL